MTFVFKKVIKQPQKARYPKCPVCSEPKTAYEFRTSNRNSKRNLICWQCRHTNKDAVRLFWTGGLKTQKPAPVDMEFLQAVLIRLVEHFQKRSQRKKEVIDMGAIEAQSAKLIKLPERIATIVGKTYAVRGDDFELSDDAALTRIRDLLEELDETLIERNKKKRLSR